MEVPENDDVGQAREWCTVNIIKNKTKTLLEPISNGGVLLSSSCSKGFGCGHVPKIVVIRLRQLGEIIHLYHIYISARVLFGRLKQNGVDLITG